MSIETNSPNDAQPDYLNDKQVHAPTTIGEDGKRRWIYPDRRKGPRATKRLWIAVALILFYFVVPWIEINGRPLLRIDVLNQMAYIFGLVLKMNEYNFVFFIFATLGLILFLVTTLRGRIWCGYACPQTVFVEWIIRPIEELLEGNAAKRRLDDQKPLTWQRASKKILKQVAFIAVAALVANAFLGFFVDPREVLKWVTSPPSQHPTAFAFVMFLTGVMYFDLGWFREQFCAFLCPYARFQAVMLDKSSPTVNYDKGRGEPRGRGKLKGDCIDCGLCVRVCPTGIDIRNGLQLECIACERCVDACEGVMSSLKRPLGLIRISSANELEGQTLAPIWKRPRVWVYSTLIVTVIGIGAFRVMDRDPIALTILRQASGSAYATLPDGRLSNTFNVRASNNTDQTLTMKISLLDPSPGVELICPRCEVPIEAQKENLTPLLVIFPADQAPDEVRIKSENGEETYVLPILHPRK